MKIDFFEQQRVNKRKTIFLIFLFILLITILGLSVDYLNSTFPLLTFLALIFSFIHSFIAFYSGDKIVLASLMARKPDPNDLKEKQFLNILHEMSLASGVPVPKGYIISESSPNAFATGKDEKSSFSRCCIFRICFDL